MGERTAEDVKLRPIRGDEAKMSETNRSVSSAIGGWVRYNTRVGQQHLNSIQSCTYPEWQEWARTAEVIHIAQPKEDGI